MTPCRVRSVRYASGLVTTCRASSRIQDLAITASSTLCLDSSILNSIPFLLSAPTSYLCFDTTLECHLLSLTPPYDYGQEGRLASQFQEVNHPTRPCFGLFCYCSERFYRLLRYPFSPLTTQARVNFHCWKSLILLPERKCQCI